jgi:hypothetical protein
VTARRAAPVALPLAMSVALALAPCARASEGTGLRARAVAAARSRVGEPFSGDCSGFVISVWRSAGLTPPLRAGRSRSEALQRGSRSVARPRPGDLAFFHHTYDRNHDGRPNDRFTHVALVEAVDGQRVTLLHRGSAGVERIRMDLSRPADPRANDPVRKPGRRDAPGTRVLAGELFAGFGAVPGADR